MEEIVNEIIEAYGGVPGVMARFEYMQPMAVYNWRIRGVPLYLIADIHVDTGIPISKIKEGSKSPA